MKGDEIEAQGLVGAETQLDKQIFPDVFNQDREFTLEDADNNTKFQAKLQAFVTAK